MNKAIETPREEMSMHAPRIEVINIPQDKIRDVIGPGGKVIRGIVQETGCKVDVDDDGTVHVASADGVALEKALSIIKGLTASPEVGRIYDGKGAQGRRLRCVRGDPARNRRTAAHLAAGRRESPEASPTSCGRATRFPSRFSRSTVRARFDSA